ncbi:hypothetical protein IZ6_01680 [Terrihabitans soli]|uniref:Uncharacterized protein n=1 Tax=Terrihabitans soli TaxID=708113 RepID=A0A6S6QE82_9HYPH|nr:hypothetical protein IZ6_01680 [Terrihabitans soli]
MLLQEAEKEAHIPAIGLDRQLGQPPLIGEMGDPGGELRLHVGCGGKIDLHRSNMELGHLKRSEHSPSSRARGEGRGEGASRWNLPLTRHCVPTSPQTKSGVPDLVVDELNSETSEFRRGEVNYQID